MMKRLIILLLVPFAVSAWESIPANAPMLTGTSSETKPVQGVIAGTVWIESDTGKWFRWTGTKNGAAADWDQIGNGVSLQNLLACEDVTNSVCKVEHQYAYAVITADTQVKGSAGFVHAISCATTAGAAATAGALTLRNALTETTPIAHTIGIPASAFTPFGFVIDEVFSTGIYAAFDATLAGVSCTVSYR